MRKMMNERLPISKSLPLKARFFDYKHFTYPWHFHPEYEIIYIKESTGTRFVGNSVAPYSDGDIFLLGSNLPHYLKSDDKYLQENSELRARGTIIQFEKEFMHYSLHHYPQFARIKNLLEEAKNGIYFPKKSASKLVTLLEAIPLKEGMDLIIDFLQLLQEMALNKARQIISTGDFTNLTYNNNSRIDTVISYLSTNYNRNVNLNEIASVAAMNPAAFCRFFKQKTGKSLKNYILDMRIAYAKNLLLMDYKSISQVSTDCGFDTISHFNKVFKKTTGYTPTEYRGIMIAQ